MRFTVTAAEQTRREMAAMHQKPPAIIQEAAMNAEQRVAAIRERFNTALINVAKNRKEIYEVIQDLKEHFHEYGFKSAAAAVESVCKRTKRWANMFCADIEAECEICEVGNSFPTRPDTQDKEEEAALTQVEESRQEEPETPAVHSADEKPKSNGHPKPAKPPTDISGCVIPQHLLLVLERRDEVNEMCQAASKLKCLFERLQSEPDPLFAHVKHSGSVQTFMTGAATMRYQLSECLPDVVCPQCSGKSETCHYCSGTGWICEVRWNRDWVKSNDRLKQSEVSKRAENL